MRRMQHPTLAAAVLVAVLTFLGGCASTSPTPAAPSAPPPLTPELSPGPPAAPLSPAPTGPPSQPAAASKHGPPTGKHLLAFHACDSAAANCNDPRNHKTYLVQSDDGAAWSSIPGYSPVRGSVPDIIRRGDTLYLFNPSNVRRYRMDTGTWDPWEPPLQVQMKHSDGSAEEFVDPSPTLDEKGRIVLFYLVGQRGSDPASCPPGQASCVKLFRSATEVEGSDGTAFTVDPGNRAEVTLGASGGRDSASDPDIFRGPSGYILYISRGPNVQALSSGDLRGTYSNVAGLQDGILARNLGGVPAGHYDSATGQYWTYVHQIQGQAAVIRRAVHPRIDAPLSDSQFSTVLTGAQFPGLGSTYRVESPGFAVNSRG